MRMTTLTMRELISDPVYRAYLRKVPPTPANSHVGKPWTLWVNREGRWLTGDFATYRDIWAPFVARLKDKTQDPTIVSKRTFYAPPGEFYKVKVRLTTPRVSPSGVRTTHRIETRWRQTWTWDDMRLGWCGRCRRPVYWAPLSDAHHALRRMPVVAPDDNLRCPICGIRRSAQPNSYEQMIRG